MTHEHSKVTAISPSMEDRARRIVCEILATTPEKLADETEFIKDLGADSLDTIEIMMEFEDEFEINIRDDEMEKVLTIGQAIALIRQKVSVRCKGCESYVQA